MTTSLFTPRPTAGQLVPFGKQQQVTVDRSVVQQMRKLIEHWEATADHRAIFLTCYAMMTENMLNALEAGEFEDGVWINALLNRFAEYYFHALNAYENRTVNTPRVWNFTFDIAAKSETHVLQNLMLGVNAHINYDLILGLVDLLAPEWHNLTPEQRELRQRDYHRVNDIIGKTIDAVQDDIVARYSPIMGIVDIVCGRVDEWVVQSLITNWREQVWQSAIALLESASKTAAKRLHDDIEQRVLNRASAMVGERGLAGLRDLL